MNSQSVMAMPGPTQLNQRTIIEADISKVGLQRPKVLQQSASNCCSVSKVVITELVCVYVCVFVDIISIVGQGNA